VCDFSAQALWATTPTSAFFGPATHKKMYVSPAAFALLSLLLLLLSSTLMTEAKTCTNLDEDQDSEDDDCSGCDVGLFIDDIKNQKGTAVVRHECTACPPGFFSDTEGKEDCTAHTQCPAGKYFTLAPTNQFDRICASCAAGKFSTDAQIDAWNGQNPKREKANEGIDACTQCPGGYWQDGTVDNTDCKACVAGKWLSDGGTNLDHDALIDCDDCVAGKYTSTTAQTFCTVCAIGRWQDGTSKSSCKLCTGGKYLMATSSKTTGTVASVDTSSNKLFTLNAVNTAVQVGMVVHDDAVNLGSPNPVANLATTVVTVTAVLSGELSTTVTLSHDVSVTSGVTWTFSESLFHITEAQCLGCPVGKRSNNGASDCAMCSSGRYQDSAPSATSCKDCDAGRYLSDTGTQTLGTVASVQDVTEDEATTVVITLSTSNNQILVNMIVHQLRSEHDTIIPNFPTTVTKVEGADITLSLAASGNDFSGVLLVFSTAIDHDEEVECLPCSIGKSTRSVSAKPSCTVCAAGKYQHGQGEASCINCGQGFYLTSSTNANDHISIDQCQKCMAGEKGPSYSGSACLLCPKGQYQDEEKKPSCKECNAGKFLQDTGSVDDHNSVNKCKHCGAGLYSSAGSPTCKTCPNGFVSAAVSAECAACEAGKESPGPTGSKISCTACLVGTWTGQAQTDYCQLCVSGRYQHQEGKTDCLDCPEGRYNLPEMYGGGAAAHDRLAKCLYCEAGTYFINQTTPCLVCPSGFIQTLNNEAAVSAECAACEAGLYNVKSGDNTFTDNRFGKHRMRHDEASDCLFCKPGTQYVNTDVYCEVCPSGFIQTSDNINEARCIECVAGRYNLNAGNGGTDRDEMRHVDVSIDHRFGFHRSNHDQDEDCNYCKPGTFFVSKTAFCKVCPNGWFQEQVEVAGVKCQACEDGRYNPYDHNDRTDVVDHEFQKDFASEPSATKTTRERHDDSEKDCAKCPTGYHSGAGAPHPMTHPLFACIGCPGGQFADEEEGAANCKDCDAGKFADFQQVNCLVCEEGTYQDEKSMSWCKTCPPGRRSDHGNSDVEKHNEVTDCDECEVGRYSDEESLTTQLKWNSAGNQGSGSVSYFGKTMTSLNSRFTFKTQDPERLLLSLRGKLEVTATERRWEKAKDHSYWEPGWCGKKIWENRCLYILNYKHTYISAKKTGYVSKNMDLEATRTVCRGLGRVEAHITSDFPMITTEGSSNNAAHDFRCQGKSASNINLMSCTYVSRQDKLCSNQQSSCGNNIILQSAGHVVVKCGACLPGKTDAVITYDATGFRTVTALNNGGWCADYRENRRQCIRCPAGWHQTNTGSTDCTQCELGRFNPSNNVGLQECRLCELGKYQDQRQKHFCHECPTGRYGIGEEFVKYQDCTQCIGGKYLDLAGKQSETECKKCPLGKSASPLGSSWVSECPFCTPGRYMDQRGLVDLRCKSCPGGSFGNVSGLIASSGDKDTGCQNCGPGFFIPPESNALTVDDCVGKFSRV